MISLNNVSKKYDGEIIFENVNVTFKDSIYGIFGPNGIGKSTLLQIISNKVTPSSGEVILEQDLKISMLDDSIVVPNWMTINDLLNLFVDSFINFEIEEFTKYIKDANVDLKLKFNKLSKGQQQLILIALTMSRKADVYILDEPFFNLDIDTQQMIIETILQFYSENTTLIISTHYPSEIQYIFENIIFLGQNGIINNESLADILSRNQTIEDRYLEVYNA